MSKKKVIEKKGYSSNKNVNSDSKNYMPEIINFSAEPNFKIIEWLKSANALNCALTIISLPDTCPGQSPLPTGTGYLTKSPQWRRLAVSDVGCGMCIVRTSMKRADINSPHFQHQWTALCEALRRNRNKGLGDLGSGNHFLDCVVSHKDESVCMVVHTGSRSESGLVDHLVDKPSEFDAEYERIRKWAFDNRQTILNEVEKFFGPFLFMYPQNQIKQIDRDHNHYEVLTNGAIIIRKGCQRVPEGELALIPSSLGDDMVVVRANYTGTCTNTVLGGGGGEGEKGGGYSGMSVDVMLKCNLMCLPHGTGRTMSRSDAKSLLDVNEAMRELRQRIFIPESIDDSSLRTELPACYRNLDEGLGLIEKIVTVVERFTPVAYIGQL